MLRKEKRKKGKKAFENQSTQLASNTQSRHKRVKVVTCSPFYWLVPNVIYTIPRELLFLGFPATIQSEWASELFGWRAQHSANQHWFSKLVTTCLPIFPACSKLHPDNQLDERLAWPHNSLVFRMANLSALTQGVSETISGLL